MTHVSDEASEEAKPAAGRFPLTHWSVIVAARSGSREGLARWCADYRAPILAFLRCQGVSAQDVEDVAHGFLAHLLRRDFLRRVSQEKGRFRTWLVRALQNYLRDCHAKRSALKRGGGQVEVSLQETDGQGRPLIEPSDPRSPGTGEYSFEWARALVQRAWEQVGQECAAHGRRGLFMALGPILWGERDAPSYREVAARLETTEAAVKMAAKRVRDRLAWLVREEVKRTLQDEQECESEIRELLRSWATDPAPTPARRHRDSAAPQGTEPGSSAG